MQRDQCMQRGLAGKGECSPEGPDPEGFEYHLRVYFQGQLEAKEGKFCDLF